jgi:hypothetical protein
MRYDKLRYDKIRSEALKWKRILENEKS